MSRMRTWPKLAFGMVVAMLFLAPNAQAQSTVITGRVVSDQGNVLETVNVYITEMSILVLTTAQGRYTITIPAERVRNQSVVLKARAFGYVSKSIQITITPGPQTRDFELTRDINRLEAVVVTGMTAGTQQKKMAFAVTSIDSADMPVRATNALASIQGKVPGAHVVTPSGRPGTAPQIILRGPKSINASNRSQGPLIIVDGVILNGGTQDLNPDDIETIEVVKGAAASSLYGSRAGSGVIQITTKSARNASPGIRFNMRTEVGMSDIQNEYPFPERHFMMMDETGTRFCIKQTGLPACSRTVDFETEAFRVNDQSVDFSLQPYTFERDYGIGAPPTKGELKGLFMVNQWPKRYNPIAQTVTQGLYNTNTIDMAGRFGNTGYFSSFSNLKQEGAIKFLLGYQRQTARVNIDQQSGGNVSTQLTTAFSRTTQYPDGEFFRLTRTPASVNLLRTDSKGRIFVRSNPMQQGTQNQNPLYTNGCCFERTNATRFLGSLTSRYTPATWVDFGGTASIDERRNDNANQRDRGFRSTTSTTASLGRIGASSSYDLSYNLSTDATARHTFGKDLATRFNLRYTYEQQQGSDISANGTSLAVPGLRTISNATTLSSGYSESSVRAMGGSAGLNAEFKERYIFDGVVRKDGSSLFGAEQRWHQYYRASFAWRASDEPWWPSVDAFNDLKFRTSKGTAGGRPSFAAQYETFSIGTGGAITANFLGNKNLRPEITTETEFGVDAELFHKYGINFTYAHDITVDQILRVPPSVSSGFSSQWQNAGTMDGKTYELSLNIPILTKRNLAWTSRLNWDRNRSYITALGVPEFYESTESQVLKYAVGERYGTIYGKKFVTSCSELPSSFQTLCGAGKDWQKNSEGYVVWVGAGNSPGDGITKNLWQAFRPGCLKAGVPVNATGEVACKKLGGTVNTPWGQPTTHWGMLTVMRDSTATPALQALGNTSPDYRISFAQTFNYKRLNLYALVDRSVGNKLMNEELHWSLGDFMVREEDQTGKSVAEAKPIGYYWRATAPDNSAGVGGFYDVLGSNNHTVEDGSYTKIRELSLGYNIGKLNRIWGDWTLSAVGRNLYTFTKFKGWDPEVGVSGGSNNSAVVGAVAAYQYPPTRTFTFTLGSRF